MTRRSYIKRTLKLKQIAGEWEGLLDCCLHVLFAGTGILNLGDLIRKWSLATHVVTWRMSSVRAAIYERCAKAECLSVFCYCSSGRYCTTSIYVTTCSADPTEQRFVLYKAEKQTANSIKFIIIFLKRLLFSP